MAVLMQSATQFVSSFHYAFVAVLTTFEDMRLESARSVSNFAMCDLPRALQVDSVPRLYHAAVIHAAVIHAAVNHIAVIHGCRECADNSVASNCQRGVWGSCFQWRYHPAGFHL